MRLQKFLADAGICSRRKGEEMILDGRVKVNGKVAKTLGTQVSAKDKVEADGKIVRPVEEKVVVMLHKPRGYVSTAEDPQGRKTVFELLSDYPMRLHNIGRLDYGTEGLLLFTNDGELTYQMTHPKHEVPKVYQATVEGTPTRQEINRLKNGIEIDGRRTAPAKVKVLETRENRTRLEITIHEGRNRQVRKMCEAIGCEVRRLKRVQVGGVTLKGLPVGQSRRLTPEEIETLLIN